MANGGAILTYTVAAGRRWGICWFSKTLSRQESVVMKYALTYKGRLNSKTMLPGAVAGTDKV